MADTIHLDLVSPEQLLLSEDVDMVTLPGADGYFGVLKGHAPIMAGLKPGVLEIKGGSQDGLRIFVRGGFAEISLSEVTVLAEEAIPMAEVDAEALDQRIKDAEEDVGLAKTDAERRRAVEALDHLKQLRAAL
ncbi:MAG: F0F1 ATP synthase subunit epsilon [Alphaproteobacteria bacterium]